MFDGSTKTFEMLCRPDTMQIIVVRDKDILLVRDEQPGRSPRIHFPGGRAEESDANWQIAAQRELLEETGLTCSHWKLIDVQQPIVKIEWFTPIFLATEIIDQASQRLDADGEKIAVIWQDFQEVRQRVLNGEEQTMQYLVPLFTRLRSTTDLLALAKYTGEEVER